MGKRAAESRLDRWLLGVLTAALGALLYLILMSIIDYSDALERNREVDGRQDERIKDNKEEIDRLRKGAD